MTLREGSATHAIVNHTVVEVGRGGVAGGLTCEYILAPSLLKKCIEQALHKLSKNLIHVWCSIMMATSLAAENRSF